jgi:DNA-binding SARP family transcriptional activator
MLCLQLLGGFQVAYHDTPVTKLQPERLQSLLAYLVLHREAPQSRQHLAFLFWPDSSEEQAHTNLRNLIHFLRHALPEADLFLHVDAHTLQWKSDAPFRVDAIDFEDAAGRPASSSDLQQAIELYQGDLLPHCYDDWIPPKREQLHQLFIEMPRAPNPGVGEPARLHRGNRLCTAAAATRSAARRDLSTAHATARRAG